VSLSSLGLVAVAALGLGGLGPASPASAFDCKGAPTCPFVKIENRDKNTIDYRASMKLSDKRTGEVVHEWRETAQLFTLWHWRYYGNKDYALHLEVESWGYGPDRDSNSETFDLDLARSTCIAVDKIGAYRSVGCSDYEDPAENIGSGRADR
jgi:hypothetical protein